METRKSVKNLDRHLRQNLQPGGLLMPHDAPSLPRSMRSIFSNTVILMEFELSLAMSSGRGGRVVRVCGI